MGYKPLEDNDPIPFGKYKGTRMIDLPINYLIWALDKAEEGSALNVYAKKNENWIRKENATGKHNRPVRITASSEATIKGNPPAKPMTALEFFLNEFNIQNQEGVEDMPIDGIPIADIARFAERYKNYFNGTPNLTPLKEVQKKGEKMQGWGDEPEPTKGWKHGDPIDEMPF